MGFWKNAMTFANCPVCGKSCNGVRVSVKVNGTVVYYLHNSCLQAYKDIFGDTAGLPVNEDAMKKAMQDYTDPTHEFRRKCNMCGKVYCFTGNDVRNNLSLEKQANYAAGNAVFQSLVGTTMTASSELNRSSNLSARVTRFNRCPYCNSSNISELTEEQFRKEQAKIDTPKNNSNSISAADELRKFKDLLDSGIITQEEFDTKKKQLLGL